MIAFNLLTNKQYKVNKYKNLLYLEIGKDDYYILELCNYLDDTVEDSNKFTHYKIGEHLYTGFYSNVYKDFAHDQIDIFEMLGGIE